MLIKKISEQCDVSIDTIRYYDKIGLLSPKRNNNIRNYTEEDVEKLNSIMTMKNMLFSLEEIKKILNLDNMIDKQLKNKHFDCEVCKNLLMELNLKYVELTKKEIDIIKIKDQLKHLMDKIDNLITSGENANGQ